MSEVALAASVTADPGSEDASLGDPVEDQSPETSTVRKEVLTGLRSDPKTIHPKFLYDERGSQLFDQITETEDYYPTRMELKILGG